MTGPPAYRVLVTGSRTWTDERTVHGALDLLATHHAHLIVVHGACPSGADLLADDWCRAENVPAERYPAEWRGFGRRAGMVRNAVMVASRPDLCLAFIRRRSRGATHCAALAEAAGIPTTYYRWDDT